MDWYKLQVKIFNMKEEVLEIIKDFKNHPNKDLIKAMDLIIQDFEYTKNTVINLTRHLDKLESTYNKILKEYNDRTSGKDTI
jgi:SMC interacting uncharacterized protein involved in chromosome segregation